MSRVSGADGAIKGRRRSQPGEMTTLANGEHGEVVTFHPSNQTLIPLSQSSRIVLQPRKCLFLRTPKTSDISGRGMTAGPLGGCLSCGIVARHSVRRQTAGHCPPGGSGELEVPKLSMHETLDFRSIPSVGWSPKLGKGNQKALSTRDAN